MCILSLLQLQEDCDNCALLPKPFVPHTLGHEPNPKLTKENTKSNTDPSRKFGTDTDTNLDVKFDSSSIQSLPDNNECHVRANANKGCSLKKMLASKKNKKKYVVKPLAQRMGSWVAYLEDIRVRASESIIYIRFLIPCLHLNAPQTAQSKKKCFDSRGRTSLRVPVRSYSGECIACHCQIPLWI